MTEKEKNVMTQELWALTAMNAVATKHLLEISARQLKCIARENADEMTPNKQKVIEEMQLQWNFVTKIHEDLSEIAEKSGQSELVPALEEFDISDDLWDVENGGLKSRICDVSEKIGDFQNVMMNAIWNLQKHYK